MSRKGIGICCFRIDGILSWAGAAVGVARSAARASSPRKLVAGLLFFSFLQTAWALDPGALPTGGTVVGGSAAITSTSATRLDIQQSSQRAAIDWQTFNIGSTAQVNFAQPNASAVALNRVLAGNASEIFGSLTANGQVFLVNPAGVLFSRTAQVNVGGLVASTLDISAADFMAGRTAFSNSGAAGSVVNQGTLAARAGGYIALLAPEVRNEGLITATLGTVAVGAGDRVTLDFAGDRLLSLRVEVSAINAAITNRHLIVADGGQVIMSARAAGDVSASVVNNEGVIQARSLVERNGVIVLEGAQTVSNSGTLDASGTGAAAGGSVSIAAGQVVNSGRIAANAEGASAGSVSVAASGSFVQTSSGSIEAKSSEGAGGAIVVQAGYGAADGASVSGAIAASGRTGGEVRILGGALTLAGASVDASGTDAGGTILVGGGYQGNDASIRNAETVDVDAASVLNVSATGQGDGGRAIVWSDGDTRFAGTITARGGELGGDGGFVETSGRRHLSVADSARVNTLAPKGKAGTWLLDPPDFIIGAGGTPGTTVSTNLTTGPVLIQVSSGGGGNGDILVQDTVTWAANTLTLSAFRNVDVTGGVLDASGGSGSVVLRADNTGTRTGTVLGASNVTLGSGTATVFYNPSSYASLTDYSTLISGGTTSSHALVFVQGDNKVYDGTTTATLSFVGTPTAGGVVTLNPGTADFSDPNAGLGKSISFSGYTISGADVGKFSLFAGSGTTTANITQRPITVTADAKNKVYGDADPALTFTTSSLGSGVAVGGALTRTAGETVAGGPYAITQGTVTNANNPNYTITYVSANLTISVRPITVTAGAKSKVYGDADPALTFTTSSLGSGVAVSGALARTAGETVLGGPYAITQGTVTNANNPNYTITYVGANLTITAKAVNLAATRTYNGFNTFIAGQFTATITGTAGSETLTIASGQGTVPDPNAAAGTQTLTIGTLTLGNGTGTATNYTLVGGTHTGTITAGQITVNLAGTRIYDGTANFTAGSFTPVITGTVGSETLTIASGTGTVPSKNVGTYTLTTGSLTLGDGTGSASNYTLVGGTHTGTITARAITVTAATNTKVYDGTQTAAALPTITVGTLGTGDTASFTEIYDTKNAGTGKTLTPSGAVSDGNGGANYTVTFVTNTTGVITARPITLTAATNTKTYDGTTAAAGVPTITSGALAPGDTASLAETYDTKNFGTGKILTPTATITDGNGGLNYIVTPVTNATGVINKAALTITAVTNTKTYDGDATATALPTVSGLQTGDTVTGLAEVYADRNAGTGKTLTVSAFTVNDGNAGNNYTVSPVASATGTINVRVLQITAATNTKVYDGTTSAAAVPTLTGGTLAAGDSFASLSESYTNKDVGTGKALAPSATITDGNNGLNYALQLVNNNTGVITAKTVTLVATRNYDTTTNFTVGVSQFTATIMGTVSGETLTVASGTGTVPSPDVVAGAQTLTIGSLTLGNGTGLASNYAFAASGHTGTIINAGIVVNLNATRPYDGTANFTAGSFTFTMTGTQNGETLTIASGTGTVPNVNVSVGTQVLSIGNLTLGDGTGSAQNYTLLGGTHTGTITPKTVTFAATRTYDATTAFAATGANAFIPTFTGTAGSETLTIASGTGNVPSANAGASQNLTVTGMVLGSGAPGPNQGLAANYTLSLTGNTGIIAPKPVSIVATRAYDATANFAAASITSAMITGTVGTQTLVIASGTGTVPIANVAAGQTLTVGPLALGNGLNGGLAANYTLVGGIHTGSITPKPVNLAATRVYEGTANFTAGAFTPTITGTVGGQTLTIVVPVPPATTQGSVPSRNVGTQTLTVGTLALGNGTGTATNYTLVGGTHTGTITARPITVTAVTDSRVYNGTTSSVAPTISGGLGTGDTSGFIQTFDNRNVNDVVNNVVIPKTLTLSGAVNDGNGGANYAVTLVTTGVGGAPITGTITPATLTVTAVADTKVYDGSVSAAAIPTISGLQTGDSAGASEAYADKNAGSGKTLTPFVTYDDGNLGANYTVTLVNSTNGSISQRALTITADDKERATNTLNPTFTATISGLAPGDSPGSPTVVLDQGGSLAPSLNGTLVLTTPATSESPSGPYVITPSGLSSGNYSITYNDGTLTVCLPSAGCGQGNAATEDPAAAAAIANASQGTSGDPYSGAGASGRRLSEPPIIDDNGRLQRIRYSDSVSLSIRDGGLRLPAEL